MSKYFIMGIVLLAAGASSAVLLNLQGASCLSQLAGLDRSAMPAGAADLERDCFIITNSYVYSLFAAVIGAAVLAYWFWKKRQ